MNQDSDGSTYATAAKYQTSQKQEAGDSKRENEDDLRPTLIGARPVASGGFSTSSVSEEFFKELKNIEKSFGQSGGQKNMLEDDAKDIGDDKAAERRRKTTTLGCAKLRVRTWESRLSAQIHGIVYEGAASGLSLGSVAVYSASRNQWELPGRRRCL
ncbi:hypothetical protein MRX96_055171 [Rhipicephalus microplus]